MVIVHECPDVVIDLGLFLILDKDIEELRSQAMEKSPSASDRHVVICVTVREKVRKEYFGYVQLLGSCPPAWTIREPQITRQGVSVPEVVSEFTLAEYKLKNKVAVATPPPCK